MSTLSDKLYNSIMADMDNGDSAMEAESYDTAVAFYQQALDKIPEEKHDWEISLHVYTALGDAYFMMRDFENAIYSYNQALQCPDGTVNGYVWLGIGQAFFEIGEIDKAKNALLSAYMLEGEEIFEGGNQEYFQLIEDVV